MDLSGLLLVLVLSAVVGSIGDALAPAPGSGRWLRDMTGAVLGSIVGGVALGQGDPAVGGVHIYWALGGAAAAVALLEGAFLLATRLRGTA